MKMNKKDLAQMSEQDLRKSVLEARKGLLELRLKAATSHVKSYSSSKRDLKKVVAQGLTYLRQKEKAL